MYLDILLVMVHNKGLALLVRRPEFHPQNVYEMVGMVVCVYNPSPGELESNRPCILLPGYSRLLVGVLEAREWEKPSRL